MIPLALLCAALIALIVYLLRHAAAQEREWARERQLLISRIQHPEVPILVDRAMSDFGDVALDEAQEQEPDDIDLVGTVQTYDGSNNSD